MDFVFYLIADLASWGHVIEPSDIYNSWDDYDDLPDRPSLDLVEIELGDKHRDYEADVHYYTKDSSELGRKNFFKYPIIGEDGYNEVGVPNDPRVEAVTLAFETRFDVPITVEEILATIIPSNIQNGTHEALWMYHNWRKKPWVYAPQYKNCIQTALNRAVKAAARVIKYFGFRWNLDTERECVECVTDPAPPSQMTLSRYLMITITIFTMMGIAMSIVLPVTHIPILKEILVPA